MQRRVDRRSFTSSPPRTVRESLDSYGSCQPYSWNLCGPKPMQEVKQLLPVSWLAVTPYKLAHPLRSSPITGPSSLLQDDPPPSCASILSPFVVLTYRVFSYHHRTGSHVPHKSLNQGHATFMPDAARPVQQAPSVLIPEPAKNSGFDIHFTVSTPHQWFACAHLLDPHLPQSYAVTFPKRSPPWLLTTAA